VFTAPTLALQQGLAGTTSDRALVGRRLVHAIGRIAFPIGLRDALRGPLATLPPGSHAAGSGRCKHCPHVAAWILRCCRGSIRSVQTLSACRSRRSRAPSHARHQVHHRPTQDSCTPRGENLQGNMPIRVFSPWEMKITARSDSQATASQGVLQRPGRRFVRL
jgi:hypothetical protein